jgi:hypothetical protein
MGGWVSLTVLRHMCRIEQYRRYAKSRSLKHAERLTSCQTGPGVAEIMDALGKERSVARLRGREIVS